MGITLWQYLSDCTRDMAACALEEARTLDDWQKMRAGRRREFLRALGLDPLPGRCDPGVVDCGSLTGEGFRARRIGFQVLPDCWSSAAVYYPDPLPADPAPGVLYVCGHAPLGAHDYQLHPVMWARRGYVCLIVDTIEQNDNPGEHHGFSNDRHVTWLSLGYSSAGGEVWNSMRALDILAGDPAVDARRLGVTGVSGGGAISFELAAADERVQAVSTLCGVSSPLDAVANRHVLAQCDCFYPHNVYRRDISEYAALIAPRAALFCFADHDPLFHPGEVRDLVARARHAWRLYGKEERCGLATCPGPHGDHPEFDEATSRWFDRFVAGDERPLLRREGVKLPETMTSVFNGTPPEPNRLDLLPHLLSPRGTVSLPRKPEDWPEIRRRALERFCGRVNFTPGRPPAGAAMTQDGDWQWRAAPDPIMNRVHRGEIGGMEVWLHEVIPPTPAGGRPQLVLGIGEEGQAANHAICRVATSLNRWAAAYGGFEPRVAGFSSQGSCPTLSPPGSRLQTVRVTLARAMALAGVTPVTMTIEDIALLVDYVCGLPEHAGREIYLYGRADAGVAVLYHALFDERVTGVVLEDTPTSHAEGAPIIGVLRALDLPQAVGLMAPRKVALVTQGHGFWTWPTRVYERLGCAERLVMVDDLRKALEVVLA